MIILAQTASGSEVETAVLVSVAKPILAFIPFVAYLWLTGSRLGRDAWKHRIDPGVWALVFTLVPVAALAAVLLIPIFWVGWPLSILIMGAAAGAYVVVRNRRVAEEDRWHLGRFRMGESVQARKAAAAIKAAKLRFRDSSKRDLPVPVREDPAFAAHQAIEVLLDPAIQARATRLDLAPSAQGYVPSHVIDGVRARGEPMPPDVAVAAIAYLKSMAGLDVNERRKRQAGRLWVIHGEEILPLHVTTAGGSSGESLRVDVNRETQLAVPFDSIGFLEPQRAILDPLVDPAERRGVVIVATAPGQGLTTLLYSLLGRHDAFTCSVKSLEKQIDLEVDGVDQQAWDPSNPAVDYAAHLQSIVRRGPDIVMVTDLSEPRVGQIIAGAASEALFYVGAAVDVAPGQEFAAGLREWFRSAGDLEAGANALRAVVAQRLMRKLCEVCRQPHPRAAEIVKRLGAQPGAAPTVYIAGGKVQIKSRVEPCPVCKGSGFFGQIGVHEVIAFDDETRAMLAANDAKGAYAAARRKLKSPTLQEAALRRVRDGVTSIEEYQRVFAPPSSSSRSGPPKAPSTPANA